MPLPSGRPALMALLVAFGASTIAPAQPAAPAPAPAESAPADDGFTTLDSTVGYIDSAIPRSQIRFRYDAAYDFNRPNRAEFFYAQPKPNGPGLPLPEQSIDYQDFTLYGEYRITERASVFLDTPYRLLNPVNNANQTGFSDLNAGAKYAFVMQNDFVASLQTRVFAPTGNASLGLGTRHVTIEPALLWWYAPGGRWGFEGEFRYWAPVGGTDFAGDVIRYGLGVYHNLYQTCSLRVAPVVEFVGWSVLGGKEQFLLPSNVPVLQDAAGNTIVNAKAGVRVGFGTTSDLYVGYGRCLTGDRWYQDDIRFEFRWLY